ncbi:MAG: hypothetical protein QJR05_10255 [Thermoanaerobacterium sp.]|nr:hypothetical protein [Thermoanaerobacterium sp.]
MTGAEKYENYLKQQKFETVIFGVDQLKAIYDLTGRLDSEDFMQALSRLYDVAFDMGRVDVMDRTIASMFKEANEISEKWNK